MNIVIAYDGSEQAQAAIDDLRRAGMPHSANALVVSVSESLLPTVPMPIADITQGVMAHPVAGTLAQAGAEAAQATEDATIGTRSWPQDSSAFPTLGSVSKRVATDAHCSVRVAREVKERREAPIWILLGVDGSPGADAAMQAVAARAWPSGTGLRIVTVDSTVRPSGTISLVPRAATWVRESNDEQIAKAHAMLEHAADTLLDTGLQVSTQARSGIPGGHPQRGSADLGR